MTATNQWLSNLIMWRFWCLTDSLHVRVLARCQRKYQQPNRWKPKLPTDIDICQILLDMINFFQSDRASPTSALWSSLPVWLWYETLPKQNSALYCRETQQTIATGKKETMFDPGRKLFWNKILCPTVKKQCSHLVLLKFGVSPMRIIIRDLFSIYDTIFIDINTDVDVQIYLNVQGVHHLVNLAEEPDLLITHCYSPVAFSLSLKPQRLLVCVLPLISMLISMLILIWISMLMSCLYWNCCGPVSMKSLLRRIKRKASHFIHERRLSNKISTISRDWFVVKCLNKEVQERIMNLMLNHEKSSRVWKVNQSTQFHIELYKSLLFKLSSKFHISDFHQ